MSEFFKFISGYFKFLTKGLKVCHIEKIRLRAHCEGFKLNFGLVIFI